ncbi:DUF3291 domain-containing protein [Nocardiopsis sp. HUAS JQ3]|uniref:DUF3291 domain-containing protein n=1 Tax=Nocardiopsis sp. HUAS JQ3 TaxID=3061629 RepID=UPI0023A9425E|nr:DUF3291 domain-containing protein [Nocardiopsis sp. HUAS JQ3]WDZ92316.1 DUF3291 domain-containing protein [Nocardiopsis sp. HUAS JQ3]
MHFLAQRRHDTVRRTPRRRPDRPGERGPALRAGRPVLVEARVLRGDRRRLGAFAAALRERARRDPGHLEEVHFLDEGDRVRLVSLWRSPGDLRSFVEAAHRDVLLFRAAVGSFPEVERTLWWSAAGTPVPPREAGERAAWLRAHGPGAQAFTLSSPVPPPA